MYEKTMECKGCGNIIVYSTFNHAYNCHCGKCYNATGSELLPFEDWKDEWEAEDDY